MALSFAARARSEDLGALIDHVVDSALASRAAA
jgi:hypothetical protein